MDRFFLSSEQWGEAPVLRGDEAHHCFRVMRKQTGDHIVVFDGNGREAEAVILTISRNEVCLEVGRDKMTAPVLPHLEVAVGIPKRKSFDLILQKAVELGVNRIQPLLSDQGNVRFKAGEASSKREKWQRAVLEACKQCGQNYLPDVGEPLLVEDYLTGLESGVIRIVGALTAKTKPLKSLLDGEQDSKRIVVMVGPEGDFSEDEYQIIFESGFAPASLGDLVLRTETAVLCMAAAVRYRFQS